MDINDIRITWTVVSFLVFLAIIAWAYSRGAKKGFDEAALLPFRDEGSPDRHAPASRGSAR
jgi:cytochrome c oxidase cbb3-type subunit 4